ncbi:hypothetical protein V1477_003954 [Vespula maculifrons]|uniref:Uncharacterized protein n=1 Tax=Vespula maculifrons TaxID=7453 RepID=A0ABD2CSF6_VESMC
MKTFSTKVTLLTCPMYNVERVYERSKRVSMVNTLFTCVLISQNFKKNKNNNVGFVKKVIVDSGIRNPDLPEGYGSNSVLELERTLGSKTRSTSTPLLPSMFDYTPQLASLASPTITLGLPKNTSLGTR